MHASNYNYKQSFFFLSFIRNETQKLTLERFSIQMSQFIVLQNQLSQHPVVSEQPFWNMGQFIARQIQSCQLGQTLEHVRMNASHFVVLEIQQLKAVQTGKYQRRELGNLVV